MFFSTKLDQFYFFSAFCPPHCITFIFFCCSCKKCGYSPSDATPGCEGSCYCVLFKILDGVRLVEIPLSWFYFIVNANAWFRVLYEWRAKMFVQNYLVIWSEIFLGREFDLAYRNLCNLSDTGFDEIRFRLEANGGWKSLTALPWPLFISSIVFERCGMCKRIQCGVAHAK